MGMKAFKSHQKQNVIITKLLSDLKFDGKILEQYMDYANRCELAVRIFTQGGYECAYCSTVALRGVVQNEMGQAYFSVHS